LGGVLWCSQPTLIILTEAEEIKQISGNNQKRHTTSIMFSSNQATAATYVNLCWFLYIIHLEHPPPRCSAATAAIIIITTMLTKPILNYFSICGRGELARLIAAAGEVEIIDKTWAPAFGEDGNWRPGYKAIGEARGFPGTMPILEQGDFAIFQVSICRCYCYCYCYCANICTRIYVVPFAFVIV